MQVKTEDVILLVAAQLGAVSVQASDRIVEDLGAESMDIVNIVAALEERYGTQVDEEELPNIGTVADLAELIAGRRT